MDIQIDNVSMIDAPAPAPQQEQAPQQRARQADAPEIDTSKPVPMPTIDDDPRTAMAAAARRGRNERILSEIKADPGIANMIAGFDDDTGGDPEMPAPRVVHEHDPPVQQAKQEQLGDSVELVVYGQKVLVDRAEVEARGGIVEAQKAMAAEVRFRQSAEQLREADEKLAKAESIQRATLLLADELRNKMHPSSAAPTADAALPGQPDAAVGSEDSPGRRIVEGIFAGDMDSAAKALDNLLKPESLSKVVDQTLTQREQQQREQQKRDEQIAQARAVNKLMATKHADVLANPALKAHALTEFNLMRAKPENAGFSLADIADVAAQTVKSQYGVAPAQPQPAAVPDPMSERRALKSTMAFTPSMGRAPTVAEAPTQNRSTVVQRMREARGLPN